LPHLPQEIIILQLLITQIYTWMFVHAVTKYPFRSLRSIRSTQVEFPKVGHVEHVHTIPCI